MKKSFLTVLFALFCTMGFAQLSFNVKAGLISAVTSVKTLTIPNLNQEHALEWEWNTNSATLFPYSPRYSSHRKVRNIQVDIAVAS